MNITNKDFEILKEAIDILKRVNLPADDQKIVSSVSSVLANLEEKKKKNNKRIASYIADKRKNDKNYAQGVKEWTDLLPQDVYIRLCNCTTIKSDLPELLKAKWNFKKTSGVDKETILISILELLECNNRDFDLTKEEFNDLLKEV